MKLGYFLFTSAAAGRERILLDADQCGKAIQITTLGDNPVVGVNDTTICRSEF